MQAIINGVRYDTAKATRIGEASGGSGPGDFRYFEADLYRTPRSGRYFVAGKGGPMTVFSHFNGNTTSGGSKIIPMSEKEAFEWAQEMLSIDEVEKHFGALIEEA